MNSPLKPMKNGRLQVEVKTVGLDRKAIRQLRRFPPYEDMLRHSTILGTISESVTGDQEHILAIYKDEPILIRVTPQIVSVRVSQLPRLIIA